jgi:hypothetical protein
MTQKIAKNNLKDCMIPVDPDARAMKLFSIPRGMQFIVSIDGSTDRLEIVNPVDGRPPFFRLYELHRTSEAIELSTDEEEDYDEPSDI